MLLRVDYAGGHGLIGASRSQTEAQIADEWSFLLWQFRAPEFQPKSESKSRVLSPQTTGN